MIYEIDTQQGIARLFHRTPDSKDSPPVLMVHGFGSNSEVWFAHKKSLGNYFVNQNMDCWALDLSNDIYGNIYTLAHEELLAATNYIFKKRNQPIILVTHSMGGIISRFFTSPHFKHPYPLQKIEKFFRGIALLTVPNHGVGSGDISRLEETVVYLRKILKTEKPILPDFGLGFIQLTPKSHLISSLNLDPPLNPTISWLNAAGSFDRVVPPKSALFEDNEINKIPHFDQQEFPCDHMTLPFTETIQKVMNAVPDFIEKQTLEERLKIRPAIHRFPAIGKWILETFLEAT
ncbi:MAG: alpha/beta hydrolase [Candidatus Hodarchaeales archaeon]